MHFSDLSVDVMFGCRVNIQLYDSLVSMGYSKGAAAEALKQANNDIQQALQVRVAVLQVHVAIL